MSEQVSSSLNNAKVIVCVGSGGVGKTTTAAALGFLAAKRGRKVLVLTIDPSKRLKTTLGISDSGEISEISHPEIKGSLSAAVINPKKTFDDFIRRAAGASSSSASEGEARVDKILNNKLYKQLSTTLSGSQEFTALEKLYSNYESHQFDLIILDTPPTKHAMDFLQAPQKLSTLFHEGIAKWFRDSQKKHSVIASLLHAGTLQVLNALEMITGSEFMHELADFFRNIESWQEKLEERVSTVHRMLVAPTTNFLLVTSFDEAKLKEAEYFYREIRKGGYRLSGIIINRAFPIWMKTQSKDISQVKSEIHPSKLAQYYNEMNQYYSARKISYFNFTKNIEAQMQIKDFVLQVPEFDQDLANLEDILKLSNVIDHFGSKD
jgi:anion-transporting  ArsA/GET3 family ATPase